MCTSHAVPQQGSVLAVNPAGTPVPLPLLVRRDFISPEEHDTIAAWLQPKLARRRYESGHWDGVITRFREMQIPVSPSPDCPTLLTVLDRMKGLIPATAIAQPHVHVLDLASDGAIDFHVDSVKFSGRLVCGVTLLSPAVMRLRREPPSPVATPEWVWRDDGATAGATVDVWLPARSVYMLIDTSRYQWAHAVLAGTHTYPAHHSGGSAASTTVVERGRRISLIIRDELPCDKGG